jgi:hypothetical protein
MKRVLSPSGILRGDAERKALVAAHPFHPRLPSNCKGATGNPGAAAGELNHIEVGCSLSSQEVRSHIKNQEGC